MGNDGGTIMGRMFIKVKKPKTNPKIISSGHSILAKWTQCSISQKELKAPIAIDYMGRLINKEELIKNLLNKTLHPSFSHISSLRDIFTLKVQFSQNGKFIQCPLSSSFATGKSRFFALKPCGHVFSLKALKQLKPLNCPVCNKLLIEGNENWIELNPSYDSKNINFNKINNKKINNNKKDKIIKKIFKKLERKRKIEFKKKLSIPKVSVFDIEKNNCINGHNRFTR